MRANLLPFGCGSDRGEQHAYHRQRRHAVGQWLSSFRTLGHRLRCGRGRLGPLVRPGVSASGWSDEVIIGSTCPGYEGVPRGDGIACPSRPRRVWRVGGRIISPSAVRPRRGQQGYVVLPWRPLSSLNGAAALIGCHGDGSPQFRRSVGDSSCRWLIRVQARISNTDSVWLARS
jgi:hypothetical protein